jgi:hypothetical protein
VSCGKESRGVTHIFLDRTNDRVGLTSDLTVSEEYEKEGEYKRMRAAPYLASLGDMVREKGGDECLGLLVVYSDE